MIWYTCHVCAHLDRQSGGKCAFLTGELVTLPISIISGENHHVKKWPNQETDLVFELSAEFREVEIVLSNTESLFWCGLARSKRLRNGQVFGR